MSVKLQQNTTIFSTDNEFVVTDHNPVISTKTNVRNGKWYYEFTHISGDNFHLAGFKTKYGSYSLYPLYTSLQVRFYFKLFIFNNFLLNLTPEYLSVHQVPTLQEALMHK